MELKKKKSPWSVVQMWLNPGFHTHVKALVSLHLLDLLYISKAFSDFMMASGDSSLHGPNCQPYRWGEKFPFLVGPEKSSWVWLSHMTNPEPVAGAWGYNGVTVHPQPKVESGSHERNEVIIRKRQPPKKSGCCSHRESESFWVKQKHQLPTSLDFYAWTMLHQFRNSLKNLRAPSNPQARNCYTNVL